MAPRKTLEDESRYGAVGVIVLSHQYRKAVISSLHTWEECIPVDLGVGDESSLRQLAMARLKALLVDLPRSRLAPLLRRVHTKQPSLPILAVNCADDESELLMLFEAGLTWFVPHDVGPGEFVRTVAAALAGEFHCPARIAAALVRRVNVAGATARSAGSPPRLTPREKQIVELVERTMTNKEIASRLGIGADTVRNHIYRVCRKLDAHRRTEIVARLRAGTPQLVIGRTEGHFPAASEQL